MREVTSDQWRVTSLGFLLWLVSASAAPLPGDYILHTDDGVNFRLAPLAAPTPSPTATPILPPAVFTADFRGVGADMVSPGNSLVPDGKPDLVIHLRGLRSIPHSRITIISTGQPLNKWETPYNAANYNFLVVKTGDEADLFFSQARPNVGPFSVEIAYTDGVTVSALTQPASPTPTVTPSPSVSPSPSPSPSPGGPPVAGGKELSLKWTEPSDTSVTGYMALIGNASRDYSIAQDMGKKAAGKINVPGPGKSYVALASYNAAADLGPPSSELVYEAGP